MTRFDFGLQKKRVDLLNVEPLRHYHELFVYDRVL